MRVPQEMSAENLPDETPSAHIPAIYPGADLPNGGGDVVTSQIVTAETDKGLVPEAMVMEIKESPATDPNKYDEAPGIVGYYARFIHNHYYINLIICYVLVFICTAVVMVGPPDERCSPGATSGQLQVCEQSAHDWELNFNDFSKLKDGAAFARSTAQDEFKADYLGGASVQADPRTLGSQNFQFQFLYFHNKAQDNKMESIFTPKKVKAMCELERVVSQHEFYPLFCQVDAQGNCVSQKNSVVRFFYPTEADRKNCNELTKQNVDDIAKNQVLADFDNTGFFAAIDSQENGFTNTTRSLVRFGMPLPGFKDEDDNEEAQFKLVEMFYLGVTCPMPKVEQYTGPDLCAGKSSGHRVKGIEEQLFERFDMGSTFMSSPYNSKPKEQIEGESDLEVRFWSIVTQQFEFQRSVNGDLNYAILSIMVVWAYIWFHTRSLFLANSAMMQVVLALPVGYFFYFNIFQIKFYSTLNTLVIYLALGIGADSVFVLNDSWKQSRSNPLIKTTQGRLNYCLQRTVVACFNTTLTTVMSFVATTFTPVMPIYAFASFASVVLVMNYVMVCTIMPSLMMIYHVHWADTGGACCYCSKKVGGRFGAEEPETKPDLADTRNADKCYSMCPYSKSEVPAEFVESTQSSGAESEIDKLSWIERVFRNQFAPVICGTNQRGLKPVAICSICAVLAYSGWMASEAFKLTPPVAEEQWFPPSHMMGGDFTYRLMQNWQGAADSEYMRVAFVFGIQTVDRTRDTYNWLFPRLNRGSVVYDTSFNIKSAAAQDYFIKACTKLDETACTASACNDGTLVRKNEQSVCVIKAFVDHYNSVCSAGGATDSFCSGYNTASPALFVPENQFAAIYEDFFANVNRPGLQMRRDMYLNMIGKYDNDFKWVIIEYKSSAVVPLFNKEAHELYDVTEAIAQELRDGAPDGLKTIYQTDLEVSNLGWTWMDIEDALIQNLITGFTICFPVAFVVLVIATGNVILALFATSTIAFIVGGVLGAAKVYYGWDLGIAESIAGVIVIGFSVDYTVHLGHMYREAPAEMETREERARYSLTYMGGTVLGGGWTTLSAGLILFLCTLTFFTKMAVLLVWTILLSATFSLFYFMPLCSVLGPEDNLGSIPSLGSIWSKFGSV